MSNRSRQRLFVFPAVFLILLLAACRNVSRPTPTPTRTPRPTYTPKAPTATPYVPAAQELVVCMVKEQEPESLFPYALNGVTLEQTAITHAFYENLITNLSYDYQAQGIEKLPSLADGDAVVHRVEVSAGDTIVDAAGNVVTLREGVVVRDVDGNEVTYEGDPVRLPLIVANFTFKPLFWQDGTPVTAGDSVYSFEVAKALDAATSRHIIQRTATYEATSDLTVRWTGLPGWWDETYFLNIWQPLPRHAWGHLTPVQLLSDPEVNRRPPANGPFRMEEWIAGDHITFVPNEHYYQADVGLPVLDRVTFLFIEDYFRIIYALQDGQCHMISSTTLETGIGIFLFSNAEEEGLLMNHTQPGAVVEQIYFGINSYGDYAENRPDWFEDVRVRQAIALCLNRQQMIDTATFGRSEIMHSFYPSNHPLYPDDLYEWPFNQEVGNTLLDTVGFIDTDDDGIREYYAAKVEGGDPTWDGTPFIIQMGAIGESDRVQFSEIFYENMLNCGIQIGSRNVTPSEDPDQDADPEVAAAGPVFGRQFDLYRIAWSDDTSRHCESYTTAEIPGPPEEGYKGWRAVNVTGWSNPEFDAACQTARDTLPGMPGYAEAHMEAQRIFSDQLPSILLFARPRGVAARSNVCNLSMDSTQPSELWNLYKISLGHCPR